MTLIKSISGIRGTIGHAPGTNLTPPDIVTFTAAYGTIVAAQKPKNKTIVVGRDARISGSMVSELAIQTLLGMGFDVVDLGLATTPTTEIAVVAEKAAGGIIVTASHNPGQWNALKLLNSQGEFISAEQGAQLLQIAENNQFEFAEVHQLGTRTQNHTYLDYHIKQILAHPLVNTKAIKKANLSVCVDAVNSVGGLAVPKLLKALGVQHVTCLYCEPNGHFPHNPEPLPENLTHIAGEMQKNKYDLGIVVDPDVDRLAFLDEDGDGFGEEYTLVAVADYVLKHKKGNTVSNLSSTRALRDITEKAGGQYFASAVGEVNVVEAMKKHNAVIGGEGNGGVIVPELHYGRDALAGIALFLSHLALSKKTPRMLRKSYPDYHMAKHKIELPGEGVSVDEVLLAIQKQYSRQPINTTDGVKIEFDDTWVHLRKSNTEPIIRIYTEAPSQTTANSLATKLTNDIKEVISERLKD